MRSDKYGLWKGHTRWQPPTLAGLTAAERDALMKSGPGAVIYVPIPREDGANWVIATLFLVLTNVIAFGIGFAIGTGTHWLWKALGYGV